jgi:DNA-binding CsgD family transcriptional regulator
MLRTMRIYPGVLDAILRRVPSAIFILNSRGHVIRSNLVGSPNEGLEPERSRPLSEQVGRYQSRDPLTGRGLRPHEAPSALVLEGQIVARVEILVWNPVRQQDMWVKVTGQPVFDKRGAITGAVMVYSDVTPERSLARDLEATVLAHARVLGKIAERAGRRRWTAHPLVEDLVEQSRGAAVDALTPREEEILGLLVRGLTNREIGAALHLSTGTVRNNIGGLLTKLNASCRTHAAVLAVVRTFLDGRDT